MTMSARKVMPILLWLHLHWMQDLLAAASFSSVSSSARPITTTRRRAPHDEGSNHALPWARTPSQTLILRAKPPPISQFDLDAIEAFERQLDLEDEATSEDEGDYDDEDDVDSEDNSYEESNRLSFTVPSELHDKRVDAVLASLWPEMSRSTCGALVDDGCVSVASFSSESDGGRAPETIQRKSFKVTRGQELIVDLADAARLVSSAGTTIVPQNLPLDILYEDAHMIVINKSPHMVVHPGAGNWDGTVVNALAYYLANNSPHGAGDFVQRDEVGDDNSNKDRRAGSAAPTRDAAGEVAATRPGIVHRLDKGTTGVLVVAKTKDALATLSAAFARRKVRKTYLAICVGQPGSGPNNLVIDKPIGRHPVHRQRMRVVPEVHRDASGAAKGGSSSSPPSRTGRRAVSIVNTIAFDGKLSLVRIRILTGRTHQIRVHLQDHRTPVGGDDVYGSSDWNQLLKKSYQVSRPLLHAYQLELEHPVTKQLLSFTAPMPPDMMEVARRVYPNGVHECPDLFAPQ